MRFGSRAYSKNIERAAKRLEFLLERNEPVRPPRWQGRQNKWIGVDELPTNFVNDKRAYYRKEYLKSEHWRVLKAAKLSLTPFCEKCGEIRYLDAHHLNYHNLYDVTVQDLQTLCRKCHSAEHAVVVQQ